MKRVKWVFLAIGVAMLVFAIGFIIYAFNNPQGSFAWSFFCTMVLYAVYIVVMAACFIVWLILTVLRK
ncbi:MAG: hypothetical protein LBG68_03720 [Coriobacteriales bacterium]|jgi:hypothetical protein|nr:hypothetical protein [Coriobacteriales bacterium]